MGEKKEEERPELLLASRLKDLRDGAGKKQREIAKILGIQNSTYSGWEANRTHPRDLSIFLKLADLYGCSIDYLFGRSEEKAAWMPCSATVFKQAMQGNRGAKGLIAAYAVEHFVELGDGLILDIGSTLTVFADALKRSGVGGLRAASHSISAPLQLLESSVHYRQLGGNLHWSAAAVIPTGEMPDRLFPWSAPYKAIITADSFSIEHGAAIIDTDMVGLKQRYMRGASDVIMLLDHSKFSAEAYATLTMCGLAPEKTSWLPEDEAGKPFTLVTDVNWGDGGEPEEYRKLTEVIEPTIPPEGKFSSIRVFESQLIPMKQ